MDWGAIEGAEWIPVTYPRFAETNIRCIELVFNRNAESHALWTLESEGNGFLLKTHFQQIQDLTCEWTIFSARLDELNVVRDGETRILTAREGNSDALRVVCKTISLSGGSVWH